MHSLSFVGIKRLEFVSFSPLGKGEAGPYRNKSLQFLEERLPLKLKRALKLYFFFLIIYAFLGASAWGMDLVGRVISISPQGRQVVVSPLENGQKRLSFPLESPCYIRPGDLVRLQATKGPQGEIIIQGLRPCIPDRTGVRKRLKKRLKMRRSSGGQRRR